MEEGVLVCAAELKLPPPLIIDHAAVVEPPPTDEPVSVAWTVEAFAQRVRSGPAFTMAGLLTTMVMV